MTSKERKGKKNDKYAAEKFLSQLVVNPTRASGLGETHILDLVITDDPAALDNIELLSPLGKSDNAVLKIKCNVYRLPQIQRKINSILRRVTSLS